MSKSSTIEYHKLYDAFISVLERELGPMEDSVIHPIIGFEFGGPPDLLLFSSAPDIKGVFYVTSDLLFFEKQPENSLGRYEIAICLPTANDWAEDILYKLSQATVEEVFDVGHTADISAWVASDCTIKGLLFAELISFEHEGQPFGALLGVGITRREMDYALKNGSEELLRCLKHAGVFPITDFNRACVL